MKRRNVTKTTWQVALLAGLFSSVAMADDAVVVDPEITNFLDSRIINPQEDETLSLEVPLSLSGAGLGTFSLNSLAGDTSSSSTLVNEDILAKINVSEDVTAETTDLLGERIDLNTGSLSFSHTDVSMPGNNALQVAITRTFKGNAFSIHNRLEFADWALDVPHIHTTLLRKNASGGGGYSGQWGQGKECTGRLDPEDFTNEGTHFRSQEYWNGDTLNIPGQTNEKLLENLGHVITDTTTYPKVSKSGYRVSCFDRADGLGEGFVVTSPAGVVYTFDELKLVASESIHKDFKNTGRLQAFMLASKVEDRFGNTVHYHYDANLNLTSIAASDGRLIELKYEDPVTPYNVSSVVVNGRTWTYTYDNTTLSPVLRTVTRPDNKSWHFDLDDIGTASGEGTSDTSAYDPGATAVSNQDQCFPGQFPDRIFTGSVTHPEGVVGTFTTTPTLHGRSQVTRAYQVTGDADFTRRCFNAISLVSKTLSGPGFTDLSWTYSYSENHGFYTTDTSGVTLATPTESHYMLTGALPAQINALDYKSTTVISPDNSKTVYYHNRDYTSVADGSLAATEVYDTDGSTLLKRSITQYAAGLGVGASTMFNDNQLPHNVQLLTTDVITELHYAAGATDSYTQNYTHFNIYGVAEKTVESNSFNTKTRYTLQGYQHDIANWVLNLPTTTQISDTDSSYTTVSETTYHNATTEGGVYAGLNLPYQEKRYGTWVKRFPAYYLSGVAAGNVNRVEFNRLLTKADGLASTKHLYQRFTNYSRGIPQTVTVPARYNDTGEMSITKQVDANGWTTRTTDLNGNTKYYTYNDIGRLTAIENPDSWLDTYIEWTQTPGQGMQRTAKRCVLNAAKTGCASSATFSQTTTYDALLRPVLTQSSADGIDRYHNQTFNAYGAALFSSHPSTSATETSGTTATYDGLQRLISSTQTGGGDTTTEYLASNKMLTTDSENNQTTTTYLAYGAPTYEQMLTMVSEENVTTSQTINVFGDVTAITQSGFEADGATAISQTEYRAYDGYHNLCKVTRDDIGTTVIDSNVLGEVNWQAQGVSSSSATNCAASVATHQKVTFAYDNLGQMQTADYGDGVTPDIAYQLDNNGNLKILTSASTSDTVTHTYNYNSLNLLEDESLTIVGDKTLTLDYAYNTQGSVSSLTYPDGDVVSFAPNGFGEPTQSVRAARTGRDAFDYVTNATYYPTGSIDTFNYGNGHSHKTTLNARNVPSRIKDAKTGGSTALEYGYVYDNNLNITQLTDYKNSNFNLTQLTYDGLDRLSSVSGNTGMGNSSMTYDALGNLATYFSKNSELVYHYDASQTPGRSNLLTSVDVGADNAINYKTFTYDNRGNVTDNGLITFTYNLANQMVSAGGGKTFLYDGHNRRVKKVTSDETSYSLYSQSGTLLYRETDNQGINYIYLGSRLVAKDGFIPENAGNQHFKPFGSSVEGEINDAGYTGHKFDTDLGLSYMQARYYDPVIGRFYSNDPVGSLAHLSKGNLHGFNRYAYANNNPYKYTDPDGKAPTRFGQRIDIRTRELGEGKMSVAQHTELNNNDAKGGLEGAKLLPGGIIIDVVEIAVQVVEGNVPLADSSSLAASEGTGLATDAIDKDLSKTPGSNKVKAAKFVAEQVVGLLTGDLIKPSEDIVNNEGIAPEDKD